MNMMMTTSRPRWTSPVRVRIGYGLPESIRTPEDALSYLEYRWPAVYGEEYRRAKEACAQALNGGLPADAARQAFFQACVEARMLDEEGGLQLAG